MTSNDGTECIEVFVVQDTRRKWLFKSEIEISFPEERIVGRVVGILEKAESTELHVLHRVSSNGSTSATTFEEVFDMPDDPKKKKADSKRVSQQPH